MEWGGNLPALRRVVRMHSRGLIWFVIIIILVNLVEASWGPQAPSAGPEDVPSAVLQPVEEPQQRRIQEILTSIEGGSIPATASHFERLFASLLREGGNYRGGGQLRIGRLTRYLEQDEVFSRNTLPFLASVARHLSHLFPQKQRKLLRGWGTLRLNALDMHHRGFFEREPKFRALLIYFSTMQRTMGSCWQQMLRDNDFTRAKCTATCLCQEVTFEGKTRSISPDEIISFYLHTPEATTFEAPEGEQVSRSEVDVNKIITEPLPLTNVTVDVSGDITKSDGDLQVDFADMYVGGLSMWAGHVAQEELIFALRPELLVIMLFEQALKDDEAVVVKGAESFVLYSGYEDTFQVFPPVVPAGSHWSVHGHTPLDPMGRRETTVVAIDAIIVKNERQQYSIQSMKREILKAALGFQGDPFEDAIHETRAAVATGKWGCVIFGGDNELKSLLQWISATAAGRELHYKAFRDRALAHMEATLLAIRERFPTTRDLFDAIVQCIQQREERPMGSWSLWQALLNLNARKPE
ncbi:LOW QUALITY PROTEIN: non-transmembrane antigen, putative [Eimeria mitis]|uniref:Non-transmembrane antigen, putative n=1 Tax=Eimeria mitis TaxID=44415 RepID=U6KE26_9EIME|nr:LOW QUALITY PROTEIN: non-transmembrane antigen, putative [Eimeria mitis]CDJ35036.1 non-transmembrane antigen, putative [Eimeria mitis]